MCCFDSSECKPRSGGVPLRGPQPLTIMASQLDLDAAEGVAQPVVQLASDLLCKLFVVCFFIILMLTCSRLFSSDFRLDVRLIFINDPGHPFPTSHGQVSVRIDQSVPSLRFSSQAPRAQKHGLHCKEEACADELSGYTAFCMR